MVDEFEGRYFGGSFLDSFANFGVCRNRELMLPFSISSYV